MKPSGNDNNTVYLGLGFGIFFIVSLALVGFYIRKCCIQQGFDPQGGSGDGGVDNIAMDEMTTVM